MSKVTFINHDLAYCEAVSAIAVTANPDLFRPGDTPVVIDKQKIAPWGENNDLPARVLDLIEKNEVVSSNLKFLIDVAYGLGVKPMHRIKGEDGKVYYEECLNPEVLDFFEDNDIPGFFLEQITDMATFGTVFPEIVLNKVGDKIVSVRHLEAVFSRFGSIDRDKGEREITKHYYNEWEDGYKKGELLYTPVLSRFNTLGKLKEQVARKNRKFVLELHMPFPGRTYYGQPYWWSIFKSGWYDISEMLPKFKKSLINNHLAVRYIVYISEEYWKEVYRRENVTEGTEEARLAREEAVKGIMEFLVEQKAKGGGMISTKKLMPSGGAKPFEDKYVEIVAVESSIKGGEFIEDAEEANNILSYAMAVHPDLNGATPGKTKGSLGGSNKRELFMIAQAKIRPTRDRLLKTLNLIKRYNGWPEDLVFTVPDFMFTTLDEDHSGRREVVQNP